MSDRRKRIEENLFASADKVNPQDLDNSIFGGSDLFESVIEDETITYLSIYKLQADLAQPRRSIPSFLYQQWNGSANKVEALFQQWLSAVNEERGRELNLHAYFNAADSADDTPEPPQQSLEADFLAVVNLAVSIRRDGLTNPITVARNGDTYLIETGERRWLAFHLLALLFTDDDDNWRTIPARVVDRVNIWRQANENNVRADLNAIDKARQFALLLMDLLRSKGIDFKTMSDVLSQGGTERDFYAQVADAEQFRVPRNTGEQIINAMGLKHVRQMGYYRNLLSLPPEGWQMADDYNLTERALRECLQLANGDAYYLNQMVENLVRQGETISAEPTQSTSKKSKKKAKKKSSKDDTPYGYHDFQRHARLVQRYMTKAGALKKDEKQDAMQKIDAMRQWLAMLEKQIGEK